MAKKIKEGIVRNKPLLLFSLAVAVLFGGMLFVSHTPGVEGKSIGPTVLSCRNNTPNGGICINDSQCQSGFCLGATGPACTAGSVGTCQMLSLNDDDVGGIQDYVPTMTDGGGGQAEGGGGGGACTTEFPLPPTMVSGSFTGAYTSSGLNNLNIVIPASPANGTGEDHQIIVILNSQDPSEVSVPMWVDYAPVIPSGYSHTAQLNTQSGYVGQPIKVAVRNWDSCQGLWSEWRESDTINQSGGGGLIGSCVGNVAQHSILCSGDNAGFTGNVNYDLVSSCSEPTGSVPKCQRICDIGYVYQPGPGSSDSCVPQPTYSCTGTLPEHSTLCAGDSSGLGADTAYTAVDSCSTPDGSVPKCEAKCNEGYEVVGGVCQEISQNGQNPNGNVFGWAWSDNVGWIKMNNCTDNNQNGVVDAPADDPSCYSEQDAHGVYVNNGGTVDDIGGSGTLAGYAWNDTVGWINFADLTGPNGSDQVATLNNLNNNVGAITGWARALTGDSTPGFDGWIKLSDSLFPTGIGHEDGDAGLTYNRKTARIVGSMWGGEVLGWIRFNDPVNNYHKVTYGKPAPFDYSMDVTPSAYESWTVEQVAAGMEVNSDINLALLAGITEQVNLSIEVNGPGDAINVPAVSLPDGDHCNPDCQKTLRINVNADTTPGVYNVVVTSTPSTPSAPPVTIPVFVPANVLATCKPAGGPPYLVNNPVTWMAEPAPGIVDTLTYSWQGTNVSPTSPSQDTNFVKTYAITGIKNLSVTATNTTGESSTVPCNPSVVIVAQPNTNEF